MIIWFIVIFCGVGGNSRVEWEGGVDGSGTNGQKWPHSWKSPMGEGSRDFAKCAASFGHLCHPHARVRARVRVRFPILCYVSAHNVSISARSAPRWSRAPSLFETILVSFLLKFVLTLH